MADPRHADLAERLLYHSHLTLQSSREKEFHLNDRNIPHFTNVTQFRTRLHIIVLTNMSQQIENPLNRGYLTERQQLIIGVTTTILLLALISYGLRLYAKRITAATVWWDDYAIGVGLAFAIIPCICNYVGM